MSSPLPIPILLLKTKTRPDDGYEAYFSQPQPRSHSQPQLQTKLQSQPQPPPQPHFNSTPTSSETGPVFKPIFVPVLEHTPNKENLGRLGTLLRSGRLREEYGGMIFTSQRAVEGWRGVVERVEKGGEGLDVGSGSERERMMGRGSESADQVDRPEPSGSDISARGLLSNPTTSTTALEYTDPALPLQDEDISLPLYVVGPATHQSLASLIDSSRKKYEIEPPSRAASNTINSETDRSHASSLDPPNNASNTTTPATPPTPPIKTKTSHSHSPFLSLSPNLYGSQTGSGALLAPFILTHYNALHAHRIFTFWEAPRLPFIPLVGPGPSPSKTAGGSIAEGGKTGGEGKSAGGTVRRGGMVRLERGDKRLEKKKLLFLVGETRRDVIPRTLGDEGLGEGKVGVEEVEVYATVERDGFGGEFRDVLSRLGGEQKEGMKGFEEGGEKDGEAGTARARGKIVVVVMFSPQGCESMLRGIGYIDAKGEITEKAKRRENEDTKATEADADADADGVKDGDDDGDADGTAEVEIRNRDGNEKTVLKFVIATIGPTTRDHLRDKFGIEPDVVAKKPSPEGVGEGVRSFLRGKGLV